MSMENPDSSASSQQAAMMPIVVNAQYVKDLSFENPNAPRSFQKSDRQPHIDVNVDVQGTRLAETAFEVVLSVTASATIDDEKMFLVELSYAGVFTLQNVPAEHIQGILLVECPRLLFPFARAIVADATRDGGFAPLMIQPVDFADIYRRSQQQGEGGEVPPTLNS